MIAAATLSNEDAEMLLEMGGSLNGVTHISFDNDYGKGMLYVHQNGNDSGTIIHWYEFCMEHLVTGIGYSWGEIAIDTDPECTKDPYTLIQALYNHYTAGGTKKFVYKFMFKDKVLEFADRYHAMVKGMSPYSIKRFKDTFDVEFKKYKCILVDVYMEPSMMDMLVLIYREENKKDRRLEYQLP